MLKTCSKCKSQEVADKTANRYFGLTAILAVIGTIMVFVSWPWSFLVITAMLVCVVLAVDLPKRKYHCKNCGNEWQDEYTPSGEVTSTTA